jgi:hypothetical protein
MTGDGGTRPRRRRERRVIQAAHDLREPGGSTHDPHRFGVACRMLRISWRVAILLVAVVAIVARKPGLLFSRAFFFVALIAAALLLVGWSPRSRKPRPPP